MNNKQRWFLITVCCLTMSSAATFAAESKVSAKRVQELYHSYCEACHVDGKQGAPVPGKIADWGERLMVGIDGLLAATKKGLKNMPANGGCASCSDSELQALIEWMSEDREPQKN